MLTISARLPAQATHDLELALPFDLRRRSRLRARLASGEEVGLFLDRGQVVRGGDYLLADDGRIVKVLAQPERVLDVTCGTPQALVRVAYHLGNRHIPLQVGDGWLRIAEDEVLRRMVEWLGASVVSVEAPFEPEAGAYTSHDHAGGSGGRRGLADDFRTRIEPR